MPSPIRHIAVPALATALLLSACVKTAEQAAPATPAPPPEPFSTAATVAPTTGPSAAGIYAASIAAAERAKARVEVASTATRDNGAIYKEAQTLFAEQKYSEALHTLDTLQVELTTPAQEKAVAELRAQIQAKLNPSTPVAAQVPANTPAGAVSAAAHAVAAPTGTSTSALADNRALYLQAKTLLAEKKYSAALQTLDTMQAATLTEAQKKAVADLRSQIINAGL